MRVLVIGSGGREHALAWRLAASPSVQEVIAVPGNPGIASFGRCLPGDIRNPEQMAALAESLGADLTVVGPEAPLVAGVVDACRAKGLPVLGPTAAAARLEGSKAFAKQVMTRAGVPTAASEVVDSLPQALSALDRFGCPVVLKADGLAAGKGVIIAHSRAEAEQAARGLLSGDLVGPAGNRLVIEQFLSGEEVSFIVLTDGLEIAVLEPTQDHKAVFDGDTGPNTGGMGAYCDSRILTPEQRSAVVDRIIRPVLQVMSADGHPFTGFLYAGLMMTGDGPQVLEFNVRMGDPETQPLMKRLNSDLGEVLLAAARGDLAGVQLEWAARPSVCIVAASGGYPGPYPTRLPVSGIPEAEKGGATVFHAGTRFVDGQLVTAGGRVLGITASGDTLAGAIQAAYSATEQVRFDGMHYRRDIGRKGLKRWPV